MRGTGEMLAGSGALGGAEDRGMLRGSAFAELRGRQESADNCCLLRFEVALSD